MTSGTGAPSASEPDGSWYLRTNGQWYYRLGGVWVALVDTSGKIPAISSTYFSSLSGANLTSLPAGQLTGTITSGVQDTITRLGTIANGGAWGENLLPDATDTRDIGAYNKLWSQAFISTLNAIVFQQSTATLFGGYSIVAKQAGAFAADVASGASTIDFGQTMTPSWVLVRAHDSGGTIKTEYIEVGTLLSGTTYYVARDLASAHVTDPAWASGTPYEVLGAEGAGRIELLAYDGKPRIVFLQQGATYNAASERAVIGNLNGYFGYATDLYGFAAGDATKAWVKVDPTNGLRIGYNTTTNVSIDASGNASLSGAAISIGDSTTGASAYTPVGSLQFRRAAAWTMNPAGGDIYALYEGSPTLSTFNPWLTLENTAVPSSNADFSPGILLQATGWKSATNSAATPASIAIQSHYANGATITLTADEVAAPNGYYERGRSVPIGEWTSIAYASGNYSADVGTWTVDSGDQLTLKYMIVGKTAILTWSIQTSTLSSTPSTLAIALPAAITPAEQQFSPCIIQNSTNTIGMARVVAATPWLYLYKDAGASNYVAQTNAMQTMGELIYEIQ